MINITVQGFIIGDDTGKPVTTKIRVTDADSKKVLNTTLNNSSDGSYGVVLNSGLRYHIEFINERYQKSALEFDFTKQDRYLEVKQDVSLKASYTVKVDVKDKDLGIRLSSYLFAKDASQVIYDDSVQTHRLPLELTLSTKHKYEFSAKQLLYQPAAQFLKFDTSFQDQVQISILLEHEKVEFVANVTEVGTKQKVRTKVHYNNMANEETIVAEAGEKVYLRKGDRYQVATASDKGYVFSSVTIVGGESSSEELVVTPIKEGVSLTLENITFASNSADLTPSSSVELERVMDLLGNNPNITIEISAHTDDVGDDNYNFNLSEKRAKSVREYLSKKVDTSRLITKGYGETKPVAANNSEINRQANRRVELIIIKVD
jgi:outer membrane protein OmpA-like peptidoglycan-associated protein